MRKKKWEENPQSAEFHGIGIPLHAARAAASVGMKRGSPLPNHATASTLGFSNPLEAHGKALKTAIENPKLLLTIFSSSSLSTPKNVEIIKNYKISTLDSYF